jgi:hypothetical protein
LISDKTNIRVHLAVYSAFEEKPYRVPELDTQHTLLQRTFFNILEALWIPCVVLQRAGAQVEVRHFEDELCIKDLDGVFKNCIELRKVCTLLCSMACFTFIQYKINRVGRTWLPTTTSLSPRSLYPANRDRRWLGVPLRRQYRCAGVALDSRPTQMMNDEPTNIEGSANKHYE